MGNLNSACSFGLLWVSPSLMQTVPETPSSVCFAPQPPPNGPKLPIKNSEVFTLMPWNDDAGVVEAAHLLRYLAQLDCHFVVGDCYAHPDRHALANIDAIVVHVGFRLVDAAGNRAGARTRHRFGLIHDCRNRIEHRLASVALDHLQEAPLARLHRRDLRAQIAHRPARQAHVLANDVDDGLIDHATILIFENWDLQAFGEDVD